MLNFIFKLFNLVTPEWNKDPQKAYEAVSESAGWVIVKGVEKANLDQLRELKELDVFEGKNLIEIKKNS